MNLTASTVTVYFIGLITFYDVTGSGAKVSVPLTTAGAMHKGVPLEQHFADIVVKGYAGTPAACSGPGRSYIPPAPPTPAICTFKNLSAEMIQLPSSPTPFTVPVPGNFPKVPHIKTLCPTASGIKYDYQNVSSGSVAARLDLTNGVLEGCTNVNAWVSTLTLAEASGPLMIGMESLPLDYNGDVIVVINNAPGMAGGMSEESHFYWYYKMYTGGEKCCGLPDEDPNACNPPLAERLAGLPIFLPFATGVGCSNTQYP